MISTAAAHSSGETPLADRRLRVGLTVADSLEEGGRRPPSESALLGLLEGGEDRLSLGVRGLRLDRRGHGAKPTTIPFVTHIT